MWYGHVQRKQKFLRAVGFVGDVAVVGEITFMLSIIKFVVQIYSTFMVPYTMYQFSSSIPIL